MNISSQLGLGTAPMGNMFRPLTDTESVELIECALGQGVNFFDTAPLYGAGVSELRLGLALRGVPRDSYILQTKVGRLVQPDGSVSFDYSRDGVLRSIDESLTRLKLDRIDNLLIHDPDFNFGPAIYEAYPTLAELRTQGVVKMIGAGMNQFEMLHDFADCGDFDCFLLAGRYSLLQQHSLGFLDMCQQRGINVWLGGTYNSGILATGAVPNAKYMYVNAPKRILARVHKLEVICAEYSVPLRVVAAQFPLAHPAVTRVIFGALSAQEFTETVAGFTHLIPAALWARLKAEGLIQVAAPTA
ncbi:MAG: aldo/keto reductase [Chloroflexi bacterium]|nr:aldo/keto reductase [Chloroflexota bacterium]